MYYKKKILRLSTHLQTKSAIVYRQIADFVCRMLRNESNMIQNFLSRVHTCKLSMNNCRTLSIDTSLRFCLQVCTKPQNYFLWTSRSVWGTKENCYSGLPVSVSNRNSLCSPYTSTCPQKRSFKDFFIYFFIYLHIFETLC